MESNRTAVPPGDLIALWEHRDQHLGAADAVYETVRSAIVSGTLRPGTRVGEDDYARHFAVSRTPVREAFLRLLAERLLERHSGRSLVVSSVSADEVLEVYAVRVVIDGLAARLAAEAARPQDIASLRWLNDRFREAAIAGDAPTMAITNRQFHESMCRAGRNDFLLEMMVTVHDRIGRFPGTTFLRPGRPESAIREHDEIIAAIAARKPDNAERLARAHMTAAMQVRIEQVRTLQASQGR